MAPPLKHSLSAAAFAVNALLTAAEAVVDGAPPLILLPAIAAVKSAFGLDNERNEVN